MRKEAMMFLLPQFSRTGCQYKILVVGDISKAEFGRYVKMGCAIRQHTEYNKNGFPIVDGKCKLKAADVVGGRKRE